MNLGGRPPKYTDPETMRKAIDEYFDAKESKAVISVGKQEAINCPSISELALKLGFCDRHSMYDYEKRDGFFHTIKSAKSRMCSFYERFGATGLLAPSFVIFMLKNYGYTDRQEIDATIHTPEPVKIEFVSADKRSI